MEGRERQKETNSRKKGREKQERTCGVAENMIKMRIRSANKRTAVK